MDQLPYGRPSFALYSGKARHIVEVTWLGLGSGLGLGLGLFGLGWSPGLGLWFEAQRRRHLEQAAQRRETDARGKRWLEGQKVAATALREVDGHLSVGF